MARARNIKPAFFSNEQLAECDPLSRILFVGLWCIADREGRLQDRPKRIKIELLPYDDCDVSELLDQLHKHGLIKRYSSGGGEFVQVINFCKHQDPHYKEKASEIPAPEGHTDSGATAGGVSEEVRQRIFDRDRRRCVQCESKEDLSLDHIVPRSKGGTHAEDNLRTLCRRCNSSKNNRQAKADSDQSSANDRPMIGASSSDLASPDSLILIPDSGLPHTGLRKPSKSKATPRPAGATLPDWIDHEAWRGFVEMRKKIRAPLTDHAVKLMVKKLDAMRGAGQDVAAVLNQSVERGWRGIFEIKADEPKANGKMAWWATDSGILAKGAEVGIAPRPGESMPQFKSRINERIGA